MSVDREIDAVAAAVVGEGTLDRRELAHRVGAARWGPGRFAAVLHEAESRGRVRRTARNTWGLGSAT